MAEEVVVETSLMKESMKPTPVFGGAELSEEGGRRVVVFSSRMWRDGRVEGERPERRRRRGRMKGRRWRGGRWCG